MTATSWTRELAMELLIDPGNAPVHSSLSLVDALDEMFEWVADPREYVSQHEQAWRSAASDLRAAAAESGPCLSRRIEAELSKFSVVDAVVRARSHESRSIDLEILQRVRETVVSDDGVQALWSDLVDAAQSLSWSEVAVHRRNLVRLQAARLHDVGDRFRVLAGILQDRVLDVEDARRAVGESSSLDVSDLAAAINGEAGLSEQDRIDLASRYLCVPFREAYFVVWLAVDRASMPGVVLNVGSVTFYDSRFIGEALGLEPEGRSNQLPDEMRVAREWVKLLPKGEFTLLARVDMGVRRRSFVVRDARLRLLTLLAPASRFYPSDWTVLPGSVVFCDGDDVGYSTFEDVEQTSSRFRLDGVAVSWLQGRAAELAPHLAEPASAPLARFLKLVEWDAAHRDGDALTRVLLAVRTIETIAASHIVGLHWQELLGTYRSVFVWSQLKADLNSIAGSVLYSHDRHPVEKRRARLREIFLEVISHGRGSTITQLDVLLKRLPEMCEIWDIDCEWNSGPLVERAVRIEELRAVNDLWADGVAFRARMDEVADHLKLQEERLARVRNAAQHGGPILDESVQSVVDLADRGRQQIIADMVDGLVKGRDCSSTLAAVRRLGPRREDMLGSTGSPLMALAVAIEFT